MVDDSGTLEPVARDPGPVLPRWLLGIELKRLREGAGVTVKQVAKHLRVHDFTINRHENGSSGIKPLDLEAVLDLYGVSDEDRERLTELHELGRKSAWWAEYGDLPYASTAIMLGLESAAVRIRSYDDSAIPGLLQTDDYARLLMEAVVPNVGLDAIEQGIELRRGRQENVFGGDTETLFLISEVALRRPVRDREVMRAQLHRLVEDVPAKAAIQVVPLSAGPHPSIGTYAICDLPTPVIPHGVYAEGLPVFSSTYWQDPEIIAKYDQTYEWTRALALSEEESARLIRTVLEEL